MKAKRKQLDTRDSIQLAGPVRDVHGKMVSEFFGDSAQWKMVAVPMLVPTGEAEESSIAIVGAPPPRPKLAPIFVPFFEIAQRHGDEVVVHRVPVEQVRTTRHPRVAVDEVDASGKVVSQRLLTHEEIAARQAAEVKAMADEAIEAAKRLAPAEPPRVERESESESESEAESESESEAEAEAEVIHG